MEKKKFIPVMLTPFKANGDIDYNALTKLTELYLDAGAQGLFANCLSSEMYDLTPDERVSVVKHVTGITRGMVPVVATGTFGGPVSEQADFIKRLYDTGINAAIVITSLIAEENDDESVFNDRIFDLLRYTGDIPLGFYECPEPYKKLISASQLKQFVETGRVIYHKDTCLDLSQVKEKLKVTQMYPEFGLYDAYIVHAVESLQAGSAGLSAIQGNYFPELIVWICENYDNPAVKNELVQVMKLLVESMDIMHEAYPVSAKYFLEKRGLSVGSVTRKRIEFGKQDKRNMDDLYSKINLLCSELNVNMSLVK